MLTGTEAGGVESRERLPDVDVAAVEARGVEEAKQQPPTAARTPHQHQREQSTEAPSPTNWLSGANNTASSTHATMQEGGVSNAGGGGEQQQEPPPQQDAGGAALSTINGDGGSSQHAYALAPAPSPAPTSASSSSSMLPLKRPFAGAIPGDGWPRSPPALRPPLPPHQQQPLHAPAPPPGPAPAPMMFGSQQQQQQHMQQHMQQQHMQQQYIMATTPQGQVLYIAHPMQHQQDASASGHYGFQGQQHGAAPPGMMMQSPAAAQQQQQQPPPAAPGQQHQQPPAFMGHPSVSGPDQDAAAYAAHQQLPPKQYYRAGPGAPPMPSQQQPTLTGGLGGPVGPGGVGVVAHPGLSASMSSLASHHSSSSSLAGMPGVAHIEQLENARKVQETRLKNLEKVPPEVIAALDMKMTRIPAWDVRITREKLEALGGVIMMDSSPVLSSGERSENVHNYAPKNFHIKCQYCLKGFNGKNALRNFELHALFWELYLAHPALLLPAVQADIEVEKEHKGVYPCNSVSRDVIVYMESKKPILCNNQKKVWKLQGHLHHNTKPFQGRAWMQTPQGQWDAYKLQDPSSMDRVVSCRSSKTLEQYDTLRSHVFAWHDSGVFTNCTHCGRVYQNTRAFLGHGCVKRGYDKDELVIETCSQNMSALLEASPEFAKLFYSMVKLSGETQAEVFARTAKRLKANTA